ncbi:MAG: bifunctional ADP-dependent NAD(P)H-hydrate dehydratase/NAD(P)H-hydrate epimerase [Dehalococcoidia bacterium]|nr:bifunctional ADP-dependent NAD(P)H-hydrate dehydratase/NAD(P)H-hydrate epimerase [Dehalococcoidia bacterium]MQG15984.1 NAD(P)H-hydrate dehydratase [SAR202 cluster bacterium]|tara:strand:- start:35181 stop:36749 length:1569 start_codon:yes stop_codon:yes gene_type:complete
MKIVNTDQMRSIEQKCLEYGISTDVLMENAGRATAEICKSILLKKSQASKLSNILIISGSGNNGGDAIVAGRLLAEWGHKVTIYNCSKSGKIHEKASTLPDPNMIISSQSDPTLDLFASLVSQATLVVDGIIGTGINGELSGTLKLILEILKTRQENDNKLIVVSIDIPTGINADTGQIQDSRITVDVTIALGYPKPAHYTMPAAQHCGSISIVDIGIPNIIAKDIASELITDELIISKIPSRPLNAHKGTFGKVLFAGGCQRYKGASYLATRAASRIGAGLVTAAVPPSIQLGLVAKAPEITYLMIPETREGYIDSDADKQIIRAIKDYNAVLIGCGLGITDSTTTFIDNLLLSNYQLPSLVVDADALTILSKTTNWYKKFDQLAILTPHAGEMSRLIGLDINSKTHIPTETLIKFSNKWNKIIVMKGPFTRIVSPSGLVFINPTANPSLASAGTGDVLGGMIAGLLAQGTNMIDAAVTGVYLHSLTGQSLKNMMGDAGVVASDLLNELPLTIARLKGLNV